MPLVDSVTCAMKARDKGGVVDNELNMYGTQNLKVAGLSLLERGFLALDMSIAPANTSANTYSTALVIGEKTAMIIGKQLGLTT
jgi:alcohol oxidase